MKNFGLIASLLILASCNGGSGGSASTKTDSPVVVNKPVDNKPADNKPETLPEVVNNTDAEIVADADTKTLKVFQAKEKLTIEYDGWPTSHLGFCGEIKDRTASLTEWKRLISESDQRLARLNEKLAELQKSPAENEYKIQATKDVIKRAEENRASSVSYYKKTEALYDETLNMNGGEGKVSWSGKWQSNLEKIAEDNKGWNVEMYDLPLKAEFKVIGLEMLPAEKMVQNLSRIGFDNSDNGLQLMSYYNYKMSAALSLYGACPLVSTADLGFPKPENKKIEIEVTFAK